ncbi:alternative oxidase, partial [Meira miltonrushii]
WAMHHATYTNEDLDSVKVVHRKLTGFGDRIAAFMVNFMRYFFDVATRYPKHRERFPRVKGSEKTLVKNKRLFLLKKHSSTKDQLPEEMELGEMRKRHLCFGPDDWLIRIVFLESVAGVPGMVAAVLRHLHSLRLLRRDGGWINTMLADAANERQHLLVALKMYDPGWFMRSFLIITQGIFWNFFFVFYLIAPRVAHRFVGILEEEAVLTYSRIIDDIKEGRLPEWDNYPAPQIAIDYWGLEKNAQILDVMRFLRADEANHRYINHTFAELKPSDFNPFAYGDPSPQLRGKSWGLTRDEAIAYFENEDI